MRFQARELSPWADFHRLVSNARMIQVSAGGKMYGGEIDVTLDEATGMLTIEVVHKPVAKAKAA